MCFSVQGGSTAIDAPLHQEDCTYSLFKEFQFKQFQYEAVGSAFRIRAQHSNLCLGVKGGSTARAANITQQACDDQPHQLWIVSATGQHISILSGMCINPASNLKKTTHMRQNLCVDTNEAQRWSMSLAPTVKPTYVPPKGLAKIKSDWNTLCFSVEGGSTAIDAPLYQDACTSDPYKQFKFETVGSYFRIKAKHSNLCLGIIDGLASWEAAVVQQICNDQPYQLWTVEDRELKPAHTNLCVKTTGGEMRTPIDLLQDRCTTDVFSYLWKMDPIPQSTTPGVNGDPIIMGLAGQIFKFEGRSGAWYSAASANSFQWNMKTQKFEGCPEGAETFLTGVGLTIFGKNKKIHQIEINVVNPYTINAGCGNDADKANDYGCLGAGSLELILDGHKIVQSRNLRKAAGGGRNLVVLQGAGIFDVLGSTKDTTVDQDGCNTWISERKANNDILKQTGTWSTVVIKTEKISFHVEYKQEWERCSAHSLDIWITEVEPDVAEEQWEGVIGETKDLGYDATNGEKRYMSRELALKFKSDNDYEVVSPYSTVCKACVGRSN